MELVLISFNLLSVGIQTAHRCAVYLKHARMPGQMPGQHGWLQMPAVLSRHLSTSINAETLTEKCPHSIAVPVAVNRTRE